MSAVERKDCLTLADERPVRRSAYVTLDGEYRYHLGRQWGDGPRVTWVMLNPSTADANVDDPTIRRCMAFARSWGLDGIDVVNLYALRSPDPKALLTHPDPWGPENADVVRYYLRSAVFAVAAWGAWKGPAGFGRLCVEDIASQVRCPFVCLGTTKDGHPRHPLYVKGDTALIEWPAQNNAQRPSDG